MGVDGTARKRAAMDRDVDVGALQARASPTTHLAPLRAGGEGRTAGLERVEGAVRALSLFLPTGARINASERRLRRVADTASHRGAKSTI